MNDFLTTLVLRARGEADVVRPFPRGLYDGEETADSFGPVLEEDLEAEPPAARPEPTRGSGPLGSPPARADVLPPPPRAKPDPAGPGHDDLPPRHAETHESPPAAPAADTLPERPTTPQAEGAPRVQTVEKTHETRAATTPPAATDPRRRGEPQKHAAREAASAAAPVGPQTAPPTAPDEVDTLSVEHPAAHTAVSAPRLPPRSTRRPAERLPHQAIDRLGPSAPSARMERESTEAPIAISIGRVEVRPATAHAQPPAPPVRLARPRLTLDDYLRQRDEAVRR